MPHEIELNDLAPTAQDQRASSKGNHLVRILVVNNGRHVFSKLGFLLLLGLFTKAISTLHR